MSYVTLERFVCRGPGCSDSCGGTLNQEFYVRIVHSDHTALSKPSRFLALRVLNLTCHKACQLDLLMGLLLVY